MADYTKEKLEQMNIAQLTDVADSYGLYENLQEEDDAPEKEQMVEDILAEQDRLHREHKHALMRLENSIGTRNENL